MGFGLELLHAREHLLLLPCQLRTARLLLLQRGLLRLQQRLHERRVLLDERGLARVRLRVRAAWVRAIHTPNPNPIPKPDLLRL